MFKGAIVAIVTPFRDGKIDEKCFRELIEFQINGGISAIVPCGTTGESATLSYEEHEHMVEIAIDSVKKRVPVIAGTGSNNTTEAIRLTKHAKKSGADAALMISPYYNRPTQEGIYQHFKNVAEEVDIPIILYNVPSRTGSNILPETVARLSQIKNIVGIKEASGSMQQICDIIKLCGEDFSVLSGDDFLTLPLLSVGGKGIISVVANIIPSDTAEMCSAFFKGDLDRARDIHYKMWNLIQAMFYETNPIPVKTALAMMGKIKEEFRLPLCPMSPANRAKLENALKSYVLL